MNVLKSYYNSIIKNKLKDNFNYKNINQVPKLKKIVISIGLGCKAYNNLNLNFAINEIRAISCQHPLIIKTKKSISEFKTRKGLPIGLKVNLRRNKMYFFLEKLIHIILPSIKNFMGLDLKKFDNNGNYNFGITDQLIFPEIEFSNIDIKRGYNISIISTSKNKIEGYYLLKELGLPFFII